MGRRQDEQCRHERTATRGARHVLLTEHHNTQTHPLVLDTVQYSQSTSCIANQIVTPFYGSIVENDRFRHCLLSPSTRYYAHMTDVSRLEVFNFNPLIPPFEQLEHEKNADNQTGVVKHPSPTHNMLAADIAWSTRANANTSGQQDHNATYSCPLFLLYLRKQWYTQKH